MRHCSKNSASWSRSLKRIDLWERTSRKSRERFVAAVFRASNSHSHAIMTDTLPTFPLKSSPATAATKLSYTFPPFSSGHQGIPSCRTCAPARRNAHAIRDAGLVGYDKGFEPLGDET